MGASALIADAIHLLAQDYSAALRRSAFVQCLRTIRNLCDETFFESIR